MAAASGAGRADDVLEKVVVTQAHDQAAGGEAAPVPKVEDSRALRRALALLGAVGMVTAVALCVALAVAGEVGEAPAAPARALESTTNDTAGPHSMGGRNPFSNQVFYRQPSFVASLDLSIPSAQAQVRDNLQRMKEVPTAFWISAKSRIRGGGTDTMEGILADAAAKSPPQLVTFIVYNLPNRDCAAMASNGEICCKYLPSGRCDYAAAGDCAEGLAEYKSQYIDPIAELLARNEASGRKVPVVVVIEPDSLPNLSTNKADPRCGNSATVTAYSSGVAYAIRSIGQLAPSVGIYLDAGNGAWLGWTANMAGYVETVKGLNVAQYLRGFATNVAGYQPLGRMCPTFDHCQHGAHHEDECCVDPCGLSQKWNPSVNALNYVLHLRKAMTEGISGFEPHMVIDTGRNGVLYGRCSTWCNLRDAGAGRPATTETAEPSFIDAYFWLKTPGESDGCSQTLPDGSTCPRYDTACGKEDSIGQGAGEPPAPEAGSWFDFQVKQLAANAHFY